MAQGDISIQCCSTKRSLGRRDVTNRQNQTEVFAESVWVENTVAVDITDSSIEISNDIGNPIPVIVSSKQESVSLTQESGSGNVAAGALKISFYVTLGPVTIEGVTFGTGEGWNLEATLNNTLPSISYDATGGVLRISQQR